MHIHSSNPVKFAIFSDQFLPPKSANIFFMIGVHLELSIVLLNRNADKRA